RFREDLYYRLNVITLQVPPLRERSEDIVPLAEHFLRLSARRARKAFKGLSREALTLLARYRWPGNVRELEHAVERAVILAPGPEITASDLGLYPAAGGQAAAGPPQMPPAQLERERILKALERAGGNQSEAARALGINRTTLWRKLREYGIEARSGA
ncbi:MAG: sigma-54-dependent Fis family transcriptional regulator, partial [Candidatus Rokubacteria bacterium]|nr:sigma-54-dependent Fis family transcriptional regulator [Candidatus Rokubacteria bacterium]